MLTRTEIERLAASGNQLRPDWPTRSLITLIHANLSNRAYRDVAVALAWIATDPKTATPGRLLELGDWWTATRITGSTVPDSVPRPTDPRCAEHPWERSSTCRACIAEAKGAQDGKPIPGWTTVPPEQIELNTRGARRARAALTAHTTTGDES